MGLKKGLAEQLSAEVPELVTRFGRTVLQLAELHNEGDINADQAVVDQVAAAHVFKFLRRFPAPFFADPKGDHGVLAWELLSLLPEEKWQAKPKVAKAVNKLVESYRELIDAADQRLSPHYTDRAHLERSVCARAEYENAPMPTLYRSDLKRRIQEAIGQFEQSQDPRVIRELIDGSISQTHRNVDALLLQGQMRRLPNDGVELERRTIDGVTYCVRARGDDRWLRVSLVARGSEPEGYRLRGIPGAPVLYGADLEALRYHFTTDCWKVTQEVQGELAVNSRGQVRAVHFDVPLDAGQVSGALEGLFLQKRDEDLWIRDLDRNFRGYHFAVPDPQELAELLVRHDAC